METKIQEKILEAAEPYLKNRVVTDLVVGLSLIACEIDNEKVGVSYVLRHALPPGCSVFDFALEVIGKPASEIAKWYVTGRDDLQRSIGCAVLTATSQYLNIEDEETDKLLGIDFQKDDVVGMIGLIPPIANKLSSKVKELVIFDESVSEYGENEVVYKMQEQPELLPKCDKMIITGSSTINGSINSLLEMCKNATDIAIVGSSIPMFKEAFKDTNVTWLSGSWWKNENKNEIFKNISLSCGIMNLSKHMIKKNEKVD